MSDNNIILKSENISKQYRLGVIGTGTISHDLNRWWQKIRGKEDPYLKIGEVNDRAVKGNSEFVWALKDINFEVKRGEVLGIIGKNGAGKSTLLKILSRVTGPTTGSIKSAGRIASLLEVGTGFHPELTGKENIFLNGAILGMTKAEIKSKLDEIVEFSGCERYVDTPVKRYSSGMRVRLAFAVASFLEPDILVVDEVLAVGDAEFQKKAIGKMKDISRGEGKTVLFVSHNMASVKSLCTRAIVLENGVVSFEGTSDESVAYYLRSKELLNNKKVWGKQDYPGRDKITLREVKIENTDESQHILLDSDIKFSLIFDAIEEKMRLSCSIRVKNSNEQVIFADGFLITPERNSLKGTYEITAIIPSKRLNVDRYSIDVFILENGRYPIINIRDVVGFEILFGGNINKKVQPNGILYAELDWKSKFDDK